MRSLIAPTKHLIISSTLALIAFCGGCLRHDPWLNIKLKTGSQAFNSAKLLYPSTNFSHDLEIEFLYYEDLLSAYINVYLEPVPCYQNDEKTALLKVETKSGPCQLLIHRLSGGQRLKIPEDLLEVFLSYFEQNPSITLKLQGSYSTHINCKHFKEHLKKLKVKQLNFIPANPVRVSL
jgi:hypothetical protein